MSRWDVMAAYLWSALEEVTTDEMPCEAGTTLRVALVGAEESGKSALARAMGVGADEGVVIEHRLPLTAAALDELATADLIVLLLDAVKAEHLEEMAAAEYLFYLGKPMILCYSRADAGQPEMARMRQRAAWRGKSILSLSVQRPQDLESTLAPALLGALSGSRVALARRLPLLRRTVVEQDARHAALATATRVAARINSRPRFVGGPLDDDELVLWAALQAALVHRMGIAYGLPWDWPHGDLPRGALNVAAVCQEAGRGVTGLLPVWNGRARVGLAYAATLAVGRAFAQWCATGREVPLREARQWGREAGIDGRSVGREVWDRARSVLSGR